MVDPRAPERVIHSVTDILWFRTLMIVAGWPSLRLDATYVMGYKPRRIVSVADGVQTLYYAARLGPRRDNIRWRVTR